MASYDKNFVMDLEKLKMWGTLLPYGIEVVNNTSSDKNVYRLLGVSNMLLEIYNEKDKKDYWSPPKHLKPLLYSEEMLYKEITHKGETFVPIERLRLLAEDCVLDFTNGYFESYMEIVFKHNQLKEKALEWHINVLGLKENEYIKKEEYEKDSSNFV